MSVGIKLVLMGQKNFWRTWTIFRRGHLTPKMDITFFITNGFNTRLALAYSVSFKFHKLPIKIFLKFSSNNPQFSQISFDFPLNFIRYLFKFIINMPKIFLEFLSSFPYMYFLHNSLKFYCIFLKIDHFFPDFI